MSVIARNLYKPSAPADRVPPMSKFSQWLCADPLFFEEDTTSYILSLLRPCNEVIISPPYTLTQLTTSSSSSTTSIGFFPNSTSSNGHGLESLPQEVLSMIISHLSTRDIFRIQRCSKTLAIRLPLDQQFWREALISGELISWLWDLDRDECRAVDRLRNEKSRRKWDWRRLVLTLAKDPFPTKTMDLSESLPEAKDWSEWFADETSIAVNDGLENIPAGLRNRRRIWKIIKGIPIEGGGENDILPGSDSQPFFTLLRRAVALQFSWIRDIIGDSLASTLP